MTMLPLHVLEVECSPSMWVRVCMRARVNAVENHLCCVFFAMLLTGRKILHWNLLPITVGNVCRDSVERFFAHIRKFTVLLWIERDAPTRPQYDRQSSLALSTDRPGCRNSSASRQMWVLPLFGPSVLWRCWLGGWKGIRPVKNWVVGCWCGYLSLASVKFRLVLPFWYRLTWVVPEKRPLNRCVCV